MKQISRITVGINIVKVPRELSNVLALFSIYSLGLNSNLYDITPKFKRALNSIYSRNLLPNLRAQIKGLI